MKSLSLLGQGFSFSDYYPPSLYENHIQNWSAIKDTNGYMHFGNGAGVISFNGIDWQDVHVGETGRATRFLQMPDNRLFVTGQTDFGFIAPDSLNRISFYSEATHHYPDNFRIPENIYPKLIDENIYLRNRNGISIMTGDTLLHVTIDDGLGISFKYGDSYLSAVDNGLLSFNLRKGFQTVPGSNVFSGDWSRFDISIDSTTVLIGSSNNLLYFFDGEKFEKFETEADDYLLDNQLYSGAKVHDSLFVIGTLRGGAVFVDHQGKLKKIFNEKTGLATNSVLNLFVDDENILWLTLNRGIQKLLLDENITRFATESGLGDAIYNVGVSKNNVWVYTADGLYVSEIMQPERVMAFNSSQGTGSPVFDIISWNEKVYLIDSEGLHLTRGNKIEEQVINAPGLIQIQNGSKQELQFINKSGIYSFNGMDVTVTLINADKNILSAIMFNDEIFILTHEREIFRYKNDSLELIEIEGDSRVYNLNDIGIIDDKLYLALDMNTEFVGLYELDTEQKKFVKSSFFKGHPQYDSKQVFRFKQCSEDEVWFAVNLSLIRAKMSEGIWEFYDNFNLIKENSSYDSVFSIECGDEGVWFGTTTGLYNLKNADELPVVPFNTNITGLYLFQDSLVYGGYGEPSSDLIYPYDQNEIRFTYSAASYLNPELNQYSFRLRGFDKNWSEWSYETQKDYTNIPEGNYVFQVRSRNALGVAGIADSITFTILPPWYRTWWAYLLYTFTIACLLFLAHRVRLNQILKVYRIRNNIASDLHDEVSATLSSISYFAQAIKSDAMKGDKNRFISLIADSAGDAKEKISDIVWAINPEHDDWRNFLSKCRRYASDLLESKDMKYSLKITEDIPGNFDMQLRQHLWLIYKEMITNAVRHSEAKQLDVIITYNNGKFKLVVQDDGKGMDVDKVQKGNGLVNIHKRADQVNGDISLNSNPGFGTRWVFEVSV